MDSPNPRNTSTFLSQKILESKFKENEIVFNLQRDRSLTTHRVVTNSTSVFRTPYWVTLIGCFRVFMGSMSRFSGHLVSPIYLPTRYSATPGGSEYLGFFIKNRFHFKTLSLIFRSSVFLCYPDFRDTLLNTQEWF